MESPPSFVAVRWVDTFSVHEWMDPTDDRLTGGRADMLSVGWLIHDGQDRIVITTTFDESTGFALDPLVIVRSAILKIKKLTRPKI